MAEESQVEPEANQTVVDGAESPAETTASATDTTAVSAEQPSGETKPARTFTQAELDEIVQKRIAKEQRKAQREADRRIAEAVKSVSPKQETKAADKPTPEQFSTTEDYVEAVAGWKANQIVTETLSKHAEQEQARRQQADADARTHAWTEQESDAEDKYEDYHDVTRNPNLHINDAMLSVIQASEVGTDLAYYLGKNLAESERIAKLPPILAAKELGKLELKVSSASTGKSPSKASPPITPIKGNGGTASNAPSDADSVTVWLAKRNAQLRAKQDAAKRK